MTSEQIEYQISKAFQRYLGIAAAQAGNFIPPPNAYGKVYEAYILAILARDLVTKEACQLVLVGGNKVKFKSSPGPINQAYPHIKVSRGGSTLGELWTDIEFMSLSYWKHPQTPKPQNGDVHELDIVLCTPGASGHPRPDQILLGVECKDTPYARNLLREILGVRRELSLLAYPQSTCFKQWPQRSVPADPPSCLLVYSSSQAITKYASPGAMFGIQFVHEPT